MGGTQIDEAIALMTRFAEHTGLTSGRPVRRYLWTDAYAVCNWLALADATGDPRFSELALRLVDQVHHTLGRHRSDDARSGWLAGIDEEAGEAHPTVGGLRIGKKLPERLPDEPMDDRLEWDRDGQYFHYLTKWMHALDQVSRATARPHFNTWARELAATAYARFSYAPNGGEHRRMHWKMSTDLSRPLVASMGHHDPLDGFVTCAQLRATAALLGNTDDPDLRDEQAGFAAMLAGRSWASDDPLGIGGLLADSYRIEQLVAHESLDDGGLLTELIAGAFVGLRHYALRSDLQRPASYRLAFRELGLAIGLAVIEPMQSRIAASATASAAPSDLAALLDALHPFVQLGTAIQSFWLDPENRNDRTWAEHRDINEVMLATTIVPDGTLVLWPPR